MAKTELRLACRMLHVCAYLMGNPTLRGERGSRADNHGFVISSITDGAMYVNPCFNNQVFETLMDRCKHQYVITRKTWLALSLSMESSGESTGGCRVNLLSNCDVSVSSFCFQIDCFKIYCFMFRTQREGSPVWACRAAPASSAERRSS